MRILSQVPVVPSPGRTRRTVYYSGRLDSQFCSLDHRTRRRITKPDEDSRAESERNRPTASVGGSWSR
jgi:hypothetical protein